MTNIVSHYRRGSADSRSLVLLDELGSGTDPVEGAALAISIIEKPSGNRAAGSWPPPPTIAELQALCPADARGVMNGCCEFDVETLRPTYRLLIGVPGTLQRLCHQRKAGPGPGDHRRALLRGRSFQREPAV